jgi:hypothetical protein
MRLAAAAAAVPAVAGCCPVELAKHAGYFAIKQLKRLMCLSGVLCMMAC